MDDAKRLAKEAFVSGHSGTTISEVQIITSIAPIALLAWKALSPLFFSKSTNTVKVSSKTTISSVLFDIIILVIPPILVCTSLADFALHVDIALVTLAILIYFILSNASSKSYNTRSKSTSSSSSVESYLANPIKPFLVTYRSYAMIMTCISILAVDFHVYPRRFAKTETFGTALMDAGVGGFVVTGGIVSGGRNLSVLKAIKVAIPVVCLGLARTISVKSVNYQEHVSEYGVHWNFFFTLAFVPVFVAVLRSLWAWVWGVGSSKKTTITPRSKSSTPAKPTTASSTSTSTSGSGFVWLGIAVAVLYQYALSALGFEDWVLNAPRTNLLSMNKEGIASLFGYISICLFASGVGEYLLLKPKPVTLQDWKRKVRVLTLWTVIAWAALYGCIYGLQIPVSRRLANLSYVLWVIAMNLLLILQFLLLEFVVAPAFNVLRVSSVLQAVNDNQLIVFLFANVCTGMVNLFVDTLEAGDVVATGILIAYLSAVCGFAVVLKVLGWKIKL